MFALHLEAVHFAETEARNAALSSTMWPRLPRGCLALVVGVVALAAAAHAEEVEENENYSPAPWSMR
jgi:hypothetical protein